MIGLRRLGVERIDEGRLDSDLEYRCKYLMGFMGFGEEDIAVIHGAAPLLGPMVPAVVDAVYVKLHTYDATWRHFLPRQHGHEGESAMSMEELTLDHPQIAFRKKHLDSYLEALVTRPYDKKCSCIWIWWARSTRLRRATIRFRFL
jgi:hypothetical protein